MRMGCAFSIHDVRVGLVNRVTGSPTTESMTLSLSITSDSTAVMRLFDADEATAVVSLTLPPQVIMAITAVVPCQASMARIEDHSTFAEEGE